MNTSDWHAFAAIYHHALELADAPRARYLVDAARACPALENEILELANEATGSANELSCVLADSLATAFDNQPIRSGQRLGAYRIEELIGCGGMGAVYRAVRDDDQFEKTVAIKLLPRALASAEDRARFRFERQHLARLESSAIARLLDGGVTDSGQPYFVLEYVEGQTADRFAETADPSDILSAFLCICDGVAHAHAQLVVHCDIKPANILISKSGEPKLLDFGIAKVIGDDGSGNRSRPLTRDYAAPELIAGRAVDTRADVYSLGVLLYQLLCGEKPYALPSGDSETLITALGVATRKPLSSFIRTAPLTRLARAELETVIGRATRVDVNARIATVAELAAEVRAIQNRLPLRVPPRVPAYRLRKAIYRNPAATWLAVGAAAALIAAVGVLLFALTNTRAQNRTIEAANGQLNVERRMAEEVTEFLVAMFDAADPELRGNLDSFTARQLLETTMARLGRSALDAGELGERIDFAVGRIANKMGDHKGAIPLLERAVRNIDDPALRRRALLELGGAKSNGGDEVGGIAAHAQVEKLCIAARDLNCQLDALRARGAVEVDSQRHDDAVLTLRRALAIAETAKRDEHDTELVATLNYGLGAALHKRGDYGEADVFFAEALELFEAIKGGRSVEGAYASIHLGTVAAFRGQYRQAEALLSRAREHLLRLYGPKHLRIAYLEFIAAGVYRELGEHERALDSARKSVAIRRELLGETHAHTGHSLGVLALALQKNGDLLGAQDAAIQSRKITRTVETNSHANVGLTLIDIYLELGELDEALAVARESAAYYESKFGPRHVMMIRGHHWVAKSLAAAGRIEEAIDAQTHALSIAEETLRPQHSRRVQQQVALAELRARSED